MSSKWVRASVPGKAILVGEHAAVYGSPALVAGVGLRLEAQVVASGEALVELTLPDLGHHERCTTEQLEEEALVAREQWLRWQQGEGPLPEVPAAARPGRVVRLAIAESLLALGSEGSIRISGFHLTVRSEIPLGAGLGSSAAVAVAVASAVGASVGVHDLELVEAVAGEVEKRQHGTPSGVDVAAVLRGGVLRAVRGPEGLELESLGSSASERLGSLALYDSGTPAESTGEVVSAVRSLRERDRVRVQEAIGEIDEAEAAWRVALETGEPLFEPVHRAHRALVRLGVVPQQVRDLIARVEDAGGAAKISGAGGLEGPGAGLILVLAPTDRELDDLLAPWRRLKASLGAPGLELSGS